MMETVSIHAWLQKNQIKCETGVPLDFRDHLFLFDIYADQSPKLVCYKSAQVGFSTMAILKSFWLAKMKRMDCIYTMPTASDMKDFVGGKVNRLIVQNPVLLEYVKDKDSVEQKQVGDNIIYYRGTWTDKAAIAVSSDLNIYDEEDRSKQSVIQQYSSRLQHSKWKWEWHFSNPSVEGNGVSRYWASSDQKHWFITCGSCRAEQYLSWPESIDVARKSFICKLCKCDLSHEDRRGGRWVRKFKDREYSGYWISLLMAPWITAAEIIKSHETKSAEYFANFVLGLPYVGEGNQVTPDIIYRNCTPDINNQERVVIGCDSGLRKHFVLGNKDGLFYAGVATDWDEIRGYLKKYKRSIAVIDALPDLTEPRRMQEEFPGRVFLCHYARDRKTLQIVRWGDNLERGSVTVDRNRAIQLLVDEFSEQKIPLQGNSRDDWADYCDHWLDIMRINTQEEARDKGDKDWELKQAYRWDTKTGNDHWVHACLAGNTLVTTVNGEVRIKDIKVGDLVLTRSGYEKVSFSGVISQNAKVVEIVFSNGSKIIATSEHKFWTNERGFVALHRLTEHDTFRVCKDNSFYMEGQNMLLKEIILEK